MTMTLSRTTPAPPESRQRSRWSSDGETRSPQDDLNVWFYKVANDAWAGAVTIPRDDNSTMARLQLVADNAEEWNRELGIEPLDPATVRSATAILEWINQAVSNAVVRVFPSEQGGICLQTRSAGSTRLLEVDPDGVTATLIETSPRSFSEYAVTSHSAAAAFLATAR
jgi:hypothetical protein